MKKNLIIYWVFTGLISLWMLLQAFAFTFNTAQVNEMFSGLGVSTAFVMPLAIAKVLAVIAIVSNKSAMLKLLAYIGLALDYVIAMVLHLMVGDGYWFLAAIAMALLAGSYYFDKKR